MPLPGVTPFPPEFAARYRARGYWDDRPLITNFLKVFADHASRAAVIDDEGSYTYAELATTSERVALNLLDLGVEPADRVVVQLPNTRLFASFYFALQRIGAIPIMALPSHRYRELRQFAALSGAVAAAAPARAKDVNFDELHRRVRADNPHLRFSILQGGYPEPAEGYISLEELHERRPERHTAADLERIAGQIDPDDPAVFQLSGGTTGLPKLIPRTHNDYAYNSKIAAEVCGVTGDSVRLLALPIAHNLPLACPGVQGTMFSGGVVVLSLSTRPEDLFHLIERHRVTHLKVVPALLIRLINDPSIGKYKLSSLRVIQSGGQRMQPEVRLRTRELVPGAFVQENFGMSEGMLFFVRPGDSEEVRLETCGRPISPDD